MNESRTLPNVVESVGGSKDEDEAEDELDASETLVRSTFGVRDDREEEEECGGEGESEEGEEEVETPCEGTRRWRRCGESSISSGVGRESWDCGGRRRGRGGESRELKTDGYKRRT
jgi:hypothetical protein